MRVLIIIIAVLCSQYSLACTAPKSGDKYDALIKLEKLSNKNQYRVTVPRKLEELEDLQIKLSYPQAKIGGKFVSEPDETLNPTFEAGMASAEFIVQKRGERIPYVLVMWWPEGCCLCGIQATSKYIEVE